MELSPRDRLNKVLEIEAISYLQGLGFKFSLSKSQFSKTINGIKHIIRFSGGKWNYSDVNADYNLNSYSTIAKFPLWYKKIYNTENGTQPNKGVGEHLPQLNITYINENWNDDFQINRKYDLLKYSQIEISSAILRNLRNAIIPFLEKISTTADIADNTTLPLDKIDMYLFSNEHIKAKNTLIDFLKKFETLQVNDENKKSIEFYIDATNLRIITFFDDIQPIDKQKILTF